MAQSTKDQAEGKMHEVKGAINEKIGQLTNKPGLAQEGADEKLAGTAQRKVGEIEKILNK